MLNKVMIIKLLQQNPMTLDLLRNKIGVDGAKAIAEALITNQSLTTLNLGGFNQIGVDGTRAIAEALKTNKSLITLNLRDNQIGVDGAKAIAEALKTNQSLITLNLQNNQIGIDGAKAIAEALKTNQSLITLDLGHNPIVDVGAKAIAEALITNTTLITLDLENNQIGVDGAKAIAEALKTNQSLITLNLGGYNQIGNDSAKAIAEALKTNQSLITLDLGHNQIGVDGAKAIAEALINNKSLTTLNLQNNQIGVDGAKAIAEALKTNKSLITLNLQNNQIGVDGAKAIAEALITNQSLTTLNLQNNQIGVDGAKAIAEALKTNKSLITLNLQNNQIGVDGAKAIAEALITNQSLTTLNLRHNQIGVDGAKAIAEALINNKSLTTLNLQNNQIGVDGAKAIAEALKTNQSLTTLNLESNEIDIDGAKAIAEALKTNQSLTTLNLRHNQIGVDGAKAIAEALINNKSLTTLNLQNNQIGVDGAKAIAEALEHNTTLIDLEEDLFDATLKNKIKFYLDRNKKILEKNKMKAMRETIEKAFLQENENNPIKNSIFSLEKKMLPDLNEMLDMNLSKEEMRTFLPQSGSAPLPGKQSTPEEPTPAETLEENKEMVESRQQSYDALKKEFFDAIVAGNITEVERCLKAGIDVNTVDSKTGETVLHKVFNKGTPQDQIINMSVLLLNYGASCCVRNLVNGQSPLHYAAIKGYNFLKLIKPSIDRSLYGFLVTQWGISTAGLQGGQQDFNGKTPIEIFKVTLEVTLPLSANSSKPLQSSKKPSENQYKTAFFAAIKTGDFALALRNLNKITDVNSLDAFGNSALYYLLSSPMEKNRAEAETLLVSLLKRGASVSICDPTGQSPLHKAAHQGYDFLAFYAKHFSAAALSQMELQWNQQKDQSGRSPAEIMRHNAQKPPKDEGAKESRIKP